MATRRGTEAVFGLENIVTKPIVSPPSSIGIGGGNERIQIGDTSKSIVAPELGLGRDNNVLKFDSVNGLWIGNKVFGSAPFRVSIAGALVATSATISGSITATSGSIGGWTIGATTLSATNITLTSGAANTANITVGTGATAGGLNSANASTDIVFWAGSTFANRATANTNITAGGYITTGGLTLNSALVSSQRTGIYMANVRTDSNTGYALYVESVEGSTTANNAKWLGLLSTVSGASLSSRTASVSDIVYSRESTSGTTNDDFDMVIMGRLHNKTGGATYNVAGSILRLQSGNDFIGFNASTDTINLLEIDCHSFGTGKGIYINHDGNGIGIDADLENTSVNGLDIQCDVITTGSIQRLYSNSSDSSTRSLLNIVNDNTGATGTTPIRVQQDAVTTTNFRKILQESNTSCTIWISNGTSPNASLSAQAGDICLNGDSGNIYRCTGTTNWTAM